MRMGVHNTCLTFLLLAVRSLGNENFNAQSPPHQVNGILGGSALLRVALSPTEPVAEIKWKFRAETGLTLLIAEFVGGRLERPNPRDRFGQRLEMADEAALRIRALEAGDSGVLTARVRLATALVHEHSFQLSVYEPVPTPQILPQLVVNTPDGCNATLQCQVPGTGQFNVFWKRGDSFEGLDWHQLSNNGTALHLSWRPNSSALYFTCLVSNPVDQKNIAFDLLSICQSKGTTFCLSWVGIVILVGLVGQITTVASFSIVDRRDQRKNSVVLDV
ncbi:SLAM family member 9-like [Hemicordylus capensis]|uniref:SLAM family member 9-like n=1 Tax=Hemicordylus capensis TaxID=884348 RepID=UPI0023026064|nr:SLAM family member 9-like [Hemicordylus capensis]